MSSRSTRATPAACPTGAAVWRTRDAGASWQRLEEGLPQRDAHVGVLREGMAIDSYDEPGLYFGTSTGQLFASADEGESWSEIASYLPGDLVGRGRDRRLAMAELYLPSTLPPLFAGLPRRLESTRRTVDEALDRLEERWPGLRDRLCEPGPALAARTSTSTSTASGRARHGAGRRARAST